MLKPSEDAYGQAAWDFLQGESPIEIIERDDGYVDTGRIGYDYYFSDTRKWSREERRAIRFARGRVLDIGCGPGRVALYLQNKGHEVVGIDYSPLMIKSARKRGLKKAVVMPVSSATRNTLGTFDTIVMFGNNFGLFGSPKRMRWLLKRFYNMTSDRGRIIAQTADVYKTKLPEHLWYHEYNRKRGRMAGQLRLRIRYKKMKTPFFDYLMVSPREMEELVEDTGWEIHRIFNPGVFTYAVVLQKQ